MRQDQQGSMEELRLKNDHPCAVPGDRTHIPRNREWPENQQTEVRRRQRNNMAWLGRASQRAEARSLRSSGKDGWRKRLEANMVPAPPGSEVTMGGKGSALPD